MHLEIIQNCFFSILSGCVIYFVLIAIKQNWVNTIYYLITFLLLPPVAFVITNVISNNLALSLGMIGALSIVRFRNPVKNPFELIIFFALITIGIGVAVNAKLGIGLTIIIMFLILSIKYIDKSLEKKGKKMFSLSFEEGNITHEINIKSKTKIEILENNKNLIQFYQSKDPVQYNYNLVYSEKSELNKLKEKLEGSDQVEDIDIRYGN